MITLRDVQLSDKERMRTWRNLPSVAQYMYTDHEISVEEHDRWFNRILNDSTVKHWIIVVDDQDVGVVNLYNIDERHKRCYWAFYIAEEGLRGRGVGSFVEYTVLSYVFDTLRMDKLCCEVLAFNESVVNMHKKFGFQQEGYFRQHVIKGGQRADIYCLAMLREEWEKLKGPMADRLRGKGVIA